MLNLADTLKKEGKIAGYRDHKKRNHVYLLPESVCILNDSTGNPLFSLCFYAGQYKEGGRLSVNLKLNYDTFLRESFESPDDIQEVSFLPVERAWMRIRAGIPEPNIENNKASGWIEFSITGDRLEAIAVYMDKDNALLLEDLLQVETVTAENLHIDIMLLFNGLRKAFPVNFEFSSYKLNTYIKSHLAIYEDINNPGNNDELDPYQFKISENAAMELIKGWIEELPAGSFNGEFSANKEEIKEEIIYRIFKRVFIKSGDINFMFKEMSSDNPDDSFDSIILHWDLRIPVIGEDLWYNEWKFQEFWNQLTEDKRKDLFIRIPVPEPLIPIPIYITNNIPLDKGQLRKIVLKLQYFGTSLTWENHEVLFENNEHISSTEWAIQQRFETFGYYFGIEAFFWSPANGGWPPSPIRIEMKRSIDPYLPITPSIFNISFLNVSVQQDALDDIGRIEVQFVKELPDGNNPFNTDSPENKDNVDTIINNTVKNSNSLILNRSSQSKQMMIKKGQEVIYNFYRIIVYPPEGINASPIQTKDWTVIVEGRLLITAFHTQVIKPDIILIKMEKSEGFSPAFILLYIKDIEEPSDTEGTLIKLDKEILEARFSIWRRNLFTEFCFRWKAEIFFEQDSGISPINIQWQIGRERELIINKKP
jgi:hypothetical protein